MSRLDLWYLPRLRHFGKITPMREIEREVDGFFARVLQHENDHLNGVLFFDRMSEEAKRELDDQLDELVGQCQQVVSGVKPQSLRENQDLRQSVASELGQVQSVLDDLLVDRPRRNILRRPR